MRTAMEQVKADLEVQNEELQQEREAIEREREEHWYFFFKKLFFRPINNYASIKTDTLIAFVSVPEAWW